MTNVNGEVWDSSPKVVSEHIKTTQWVGHTSTGNTSLIPLASATPLSQSSRQTKKCKTLHVPQAQVPQLGVEFCVCGSCSIFRFPLVGVPNRLGNSFLSSSRMIFCCIGITWDSDFVRNVAEGLRFGPFTLRFQLGYECCCLWPHFGLFRVGLGVIEGLLQVGLGV